MADAETPTSPAPGDGEPDHFMATLAPYEVSEALKPRIDRLDLWNCIADLRMEKIVRCSLMAKQ